MDHSRVLTEPSQVDPMTAEIRKKTLNERTHVLPDGTIIGRDQAAAWVLWQLGQDILRSETVCGGNSGNRRQSRVSGLAAVVHCVKIAPGMHLGCPRGRAAARGFATASPSVSHLQGQSCQPQRRRAWSGGPMSSAPTTAVVKPQGVRRPPLPIVY